MQRAGYGAMFLSGAMAAMCGCGFAALPALTMKDTLRAWAWERGTATVLEVSLREGGGTADVVGRYAYEWQGRKHQGTKVDFSTPSSGKVHRERHEILSAALAAEKPVEVWINPADPADAVLFREPDWEILVFVAFGAFFALPGLGFLAFGLAGLLKRGELGRTVHAGAWLPSLPVIPKDGGFELVDEADTWRGHGLIGAMAVFWNALTWGFVVIIGLLIGRGEMEGAPAIFVPLFLLPFVAIGIGLAWWWLRSARRTWRMPAGHLWLSSWPLRLGQPVQARFHRPLRGAKGNEVIDAMGGTLRLQEIARYRVGTDTRTVTETVQEHPLDLSGARVDRAGVIAEFAFTPPGEGPPSFQADSNHLAWHVRLVVRARGFPEDDSEFEVLVLPGGTP